jgi:hypothetical protein
MRTIGQRLVFAMLAVVVLAARPAGALIEVFAGHAPMDDHNWPAGALAVVNLPTRVGGWEGPPFGGGQYCFQYRGDAAAFQQALDALAGVRAPAVNVCVHDGGPTEDPILAADHGDAHYDWSFTVWDARSWNQLYNDPQDRSMAGDDSFREPVAPPQLDVFVGRGGIDFAQVRVPAGVRLIDERASANGFPDGSAIIGDVFDMDTSKPLDGARVTLARAGGEGKTTDVASTVADGAGRFCLRATPTGWFSVIASADGHAPRVLGTVQLRGDTYKHFTAELSATATVDGTTVDNDGRPLAGVVVQADFVTGEDGRSYVLPRQPCATTDAHGQFTLTDLPRGHLQLLPESKDHAGLDALQVFASPSDRLTVHLTSTGSIRGRVVDGAGHPATLGNVDVAPPGAPIGHWSGSSNTAADGSFHFENVPPGKYIVTGRAKNPGPAFPGADPNARTITVTAGQTVRVEVIGR